MAALSASDIEELRGLLQDAAVKCSERCLYQSAKWAAELLTSLPPHTTSPTDTEPNSPTSPVPHRSNLLDAHEARREAAERDRFLFAKTLFDCREFERAAGVFFGADGLPKPPPPQPQAQSQPRPRQPQERKAPPRDSGAELSQKSLFLALYARYMAGEKAKDEDSEVILGPADGGATVNRRLGEIARVLAARLALQEERGERGQGWLEFLYGVVLAKEKNDDAAREWLVKSVLLYPYNWGAWLELNALVASVEELHAILAQLSQNIMSFIFRIFANQELLQFSDELIRHLKQLKSIFPTSLFLKAQKALFYHHVKDFEKAEHIFSKIIVADPHRLDSLDSYSNCLYVMDKRPRLAFLAQLTMATDKFRPETCCVVGNYYSMKSEHEKAVIYFRRALTLDRNFLAAWTLMGHEYIEMKNTHAAIESYRRAVDVNRKDYRAWYGLGQTYEILDMHFYALYYYQRAAALASSDPKMWLAVGSCLAKMDRPEQAIKAYKRALLAGSQYETASSFGSSATRIPSQPQRAPMDPEPLYQIALQYARLGARTQAKSFMELVLEQEEGPTDDNDEESVLGRSFSSAAHAGEPRERFQGVGVTPTTSKARLWLARYEYALGGDGLRRAMQLANELCQDGVEVEEAKALVRDVRARMEIEDGTLME